MLVKRRLLPLLFIVPIACSDPFSDVDGGDVGGDAGGDLAVDSSGTDVSITPGDPDTLLLRGLVVTPDQVLSPGEVLTHKDAILCVAASCSADPQAKGATIIETGADEIIYPGLVDAHNHTEYNYLPKWVHTKMYTNHNQWQAASDYKDFTSFHGTLKSTVVCEMIKYGEIRSLIAGATTIQGTALRKCADTLIRNADLPYHGFAGGDTVRTNILGASNIDATYAQKLLDGFSTGDITAYVIHLAEGIDETARKEFDILESWGLLKPQTVVIHGTALGQPELTKMKAAGMPLIWSPSSNLDLYGETNDIAMVWNLGIQMALSPDWTPSGEPNMLDELRLAWQMNKDKLGNLWTTQDVVRMATSHAAEVLRFGKQIGSLEPGKHADVLVLRGESSKPHESLLTARLPQVRLVVVKGKALYGDPELMTKLAPNTYCETVTICNGSKVLCVKESDSDTNKLNQSLGDIETALGAYTPGIHPLSTNCQ